MFASVIIPTRDRASCLSGVLESLLKQTVPQDHFEVMVVDNGSTDSTRELCASFALKMPRLQYLYEETPGLHAGRHRGVVTAKADILVFGDDDIQASPTWLEGIAEAFCDEQAVLVGGKDLPKFQQEPPLWIKRMWEKGRDGARMLPYLSIMDLGDEVKAISPYYVFGCNFSIRKAVLIEAGGFHPDAMPPELLRYRGDGETHVARYVAERGLKALYHPKASVHHLVPTDRMTESYFVKRAFLQGISDSYADLRSRKKPSPLKILYLKGRHRLLLGMKFIRKARIQTGYVRGYCYHQDQVREDPELYRWVMRETYISSTLDSALTPGR